MAAVLLIALLVSVITLGLLVQSQSKTIKKYEKELTIKARKKNNATNK